MYATTVAVAASQRLRTYTFIVERQNDGTASVQLESRTEVRTQLVPASTQTLWLTSAVTLTARVWEPEQQQQQQTQLATLV